MEIVVTGRNTEIPERFRVHVVEKVSKVESLSRRIQRIDVELTHEPNPRQAEHAERIELTLRGKGPVIRAEASASDRYAALDLATAKLVERVRRHRDRWKGHHRKGQKLPSELLMPEIEDIESIDLDAEPTAAPWDLRTGDADQGAEQPEHPTPPGAPGEVTEGQLGDSPVILRQKLHEAVPMTVDQALYQMELLGHQFFLFIDDETGQPAVAYQRRGWAYGVLRLDTKVEGWTGSTQGQAALDHVAGV